MARWSNQESAGNGMFLLGALAGALVGAGVALLMAPKPGAQVRQDLNQGFNTREGRRGAALSRSRRQGRPRSCTNRKRPATASTAAPPRPISESFPSTPGTGGYQS